MVNFSQYSFLPTGTPTWNITPIRYYSMAFSSDGKTLAAAKPRDNGNEAVVCWYASTGAILTEFPGYSFVAFSPSDPGKAVVVGPSGISTIINDNPSVPMSLWRVGSVGNAGWIKQAATVAFSPLFGDHCTILWHPYELYKVPLSSFSINDESSPYARLPAPILTWVRSPVDPDTIFVCCGDGQQRTITYGSKKKDYETCSETGEAGNTAITTSAWSPDGKWIATGDIYGSVRLWNARSRSNASHSLARTLPPLRTDQIITLTFTLDSATLLIVSFDEYVDVWDMINGAYIENSGLPSRARNIALDGPRNIVAVITANHQIAMYSLQLRVDVGKQPGPPSSKNPNVLPVPLTLAEYNITHNIVKSRPDPFVGLYFDVYRGAWKLDTPRRFQYVVAIKVLRPGFNPRGKKQERQDFQDSLTSFLVKWGSLSHDNLVPLLGISTAFGWFPAIVTSWMINGLLSEYLQSEDDEYDKMQLVKDVASGVAYLHSEKIIHADIRASSILVDELGHARLADPGILRLLAKSPLVVSGIVNHPYRWTAPEILNDSSVEANYQTDIYSFTMTSLEIFTGLQPFDGVSEALVPGKVFQNERPGRPDDVGDSLWTLWGEGWNADPLKRPEMAPYMERLNLIATPGPTAQLS